MTTTAIQEFVAKWGLGQESVDLLTEMEPDVAHSVMQDFIPRANTNNPNDLFAAFARSRVRSSRTGVPGGGMVSRQDIEEFIQKFGLNADSYATLLQLPINVLDGVLRAFKPREDARDINNMFQAFARSRLQNAVAAYQAQMAGQQHQYAQSEEMQQHSANPAFAAQQQQAQMFAMQQQQNPYAQFGGLPMMQAQAQQMMNPMMQLQQMGAMAGGALAGLPGAHFGAVPHIHGVAAAGPVEIKEFARRHNLNETCEVLLDSFNPHHPQTLDRLILEYQEPTAGEDPSAAFMSFWQPRALKALSDRYGMNRENIQYFSNMDLMLQAAVVKEFSPREAAAVHDMNKLLASFMKSRVRTAQAQMQAQAFPGAETGAEQYDPALTFMQQPGSMMYTQQPAAMMSRKRPLDNVSGFLQQWNLNPVSESVMRSLSPAQQEEVIQRFAPKHNTRDVDALFKKFALSVQVKG